MNYQKFKSMTKEQHEKEARWYRMTAQLNRAKGSESLANLYEQQAKLHEEAAKGGQASKSQGQED